MRINRGLLLLVTLFVSACAMTGTFDSARLVSALRDGAGPEICMPPPSDAVSHETFRRWFEHVLASVGELPADAWEDCVKELFSNLEEERRETAIGSLAARLNAELLNDKTDSQARRARLQSLLVVFDHCPYPRAAPYVFYESLETLKAMQAANENQQRADAMDAWKERIELLYGSCGGSVCTAHAIHNEGNIERLLRMSRLLQADGMRYLAKEQIVRLRLRASPYRELLERESEVINAVLEKGHYVPPLDLYEPVALEVAQDVLPEATLLAPLQDFSAYILKPANAKGQATSSALKIGEALRVKLRGMRRSAHLCGALGPLDPTPCLQQDALVPEIGTWVGPLLFH